jgi:hypothetical protein
VKALAAAWIESPEIGVRGVVTRNAQTSFAVAPAPAPVASVSIPQLTVVPGEDDVGPQVIVAVLLITEGLATVGVVGPNT